MRTPGTPGTGITGAKAKKSLGGDNQLLPHAGPEMQCRCTRARNRNREAGAYLFFGRRDVTERFAHYAAASTCDAPLDPINEVGQ
jgi:hypothetical protein